MYNAVDGEHPSSDGDETYARFDLVHRRGRVPSNSIPSTNPFATLLPVPDASVGSSSQANYSATTPEGPEISAIPQTEELLSHQQVFAPPNNLGDNYPLVSNAHHSISGALDPHAFYAALSAMDDSFLGNINQVGGWPAQVSSQDLNLSMLLGTLGSHVSFVGDSLSINSSVVDPFGGPLQKRKRQDSNVPEDTPVPKSIRLNGPDIRTILNDTYGYEFVQQAAYMQKTGNGPSGLQALFSHHSLTLLFNILGCKSFGCVETLSTSWEREEVRLGESVVSAGEIARALGWKINTLDNRRVFMNKAFTLFGLPWEYNLCMTFLICSHIKLFIGTGKAMSIQYDHLQHYLRDDPIRTTSSQYCWWPLKHHNTYWSKGHSSSNVDHRVVERMGTQILGCTS
ncbi:hypothetical protein M407DRAFT_21590 [Tulasnella calospora MUT 4182]|uniref:Uncharacterized protein n=1 Tax=Tulasnella calospora MUT 4182 TaxID=1051891 RepID=A0A0C3QMQ6_9AGAM|nr:hypothetical protein M407DRAFT_21590 [Tulasnella calospora MUT 4182]